MTLEFQLNRPLASVMIEAAALRLHHLAPAAIAPHPLLGRLAHPGLELLLHLRRDPAHVLGLVGGAPDFQLLDLYSKAALAADAHAARHPDAGAGGARNQGGRGHRGRRPAEEGHRDAAALVQVADDADAAALAHEAHDLPADGMGL